ncbi:unnamed protein product, partial [Owenia fusiformis]
ISFSMVYRQLHSGRTNWAQLFHKNILCRSIKNCKNNSANMTWLNIAVFMGSCQNINVFKEKKDHLCQGSQTLNFLMKRGGVLFFHRKYIAILTHNGVLNVDNMR